MLRLRAPGGEAPGRSGEPEAIIDSYRRLAEVFHDVLSEQSLDRLLERIADTLAELIPYDTLTIYQANEPERVLIPVLARDAWAAQILQTRTPLGTGITGWAAERREAVLVHQAQLDPRVAIVPGTPADEPEALIAVPLVARGALKGSLNVYRLGDEATFSEEEFELAKRFGDAAALAIDNAETRARLEHQAKTDSLTGLLNHRAFHERLRSELGRASRTQDAVALLLLDVDDFKHVNDVHGHAAGDALLRRLGEIVCATVRISDVVCRLGGDELAVIMPACDAASAVALAERLSARLAGEPFEPAGALRVSIGIAHAPEHAMNPRDLVACAETAMMTAKAQGKGRVCRFGDTLPERPRREEDDWRDARHIAYLKLLQSLVGKLNRLNDVGEIGKAIVEELRSLIDYHNGRVYLLEQDRLVPIAFRGELGEYGEESTDVLVCRLGEGITGHAAATGASLLVPDALSCPYAVQVPGTPEIEESIIAVPMSYAGRVIGVIVVSKLGRGQFDEDDVRLIEVLAGHASVALENARLYREARREADRARDSAEIARALLEFSREVSAAEELDQAMGRIVELSAKVLGAPQASIWLPGAEDGEIVFGAEWGHTEAQRRLLPELRFDRQRLRELAELADPAVLWSADFLDARSLAGMASPCYAVAPLRLDGGRCGFLAAALSPDDDPAATKRTLRLLAGLAHQAKLAVENARNFANLERTFLSTIEALANALEASDENTSSHARSLRDTALAVGLELGLDPPALKRLELGALFHDIGKIGIPSEILRKRGPLSADERVLVELHPIFGERILAPIERLVPVRAIVRHCHEHFDGTGYPDGLAGEAIPLEARIVLVCDVYHSLIADRPYRPRVSRAEARRRLEEGAGSRFDPAVVAAFLRVVPSAT